MPVNEAPMQQASGERRLKICWILLLLWVVTFLGAMIYPSPFLGAFTLLLPVVLLLQGSILYGWGGIVCYLVIGLAIGFGLEASSVANGFPFGSYTHNVAGPKPAGVAPLAIVSYAVIGWFSLLIGKVIALETPWLPQRFSKFTVPVIAAFVVAGMDLPLDPMGATIKRDWTYAHPSGLYGVPLTNLLGWLFTSWLIFQVFMLVEDRFKAASASRGRAFWTIAPLIWVVMWFQLPAGWMRASEATVTAGSRSYVIADIHEGGIMAGVFSILFMAIVALNRIWFTSRCFERD